MYYIRLNTDLSSDIIELWHKDADVSNLLKDEPNIYGPYDSQAEALNHLANLIKDRLKE